jgi:putative flippase GtrA
VSAWARGGAIGEVIRFLAVGGTNTIVTGLLFLGLSYLVHPSLAFTAAFGLGIAFSVLVTPELVFLRQASRRQRAMYAVWYAAVYLVGLGIVQVLHDRLAFDRLATVVLTAAATATMSFLGARWLFGSARLA